MGTLDEGAGRQDLRSRRARVQLPEWLSGGNPAELAEAAKWVASLDSEGSWLIALEERAKGRKPRLLEHRRIANAVNSAAKGSYALFKSLSAHDAIASTDHGRVRFEIRRMIELGETNAATKWNAISVATLTAPEHQLAETVRECLEGGLLTDFPAASVHLIRVADELPMRFVSVRALLQAVEEPDLWQDQAGFRGFRSAVGLLDNTMVGWRPYFGTFLLCMSPWVLGLPTARIGAVIVYLFGDPVFGRSGDAVEPLHLASPSGSTSVRTLDRPSPMQVESALSWWSSALNGVMEELLDPCNFVSEAGDYQLVEHLQDLLTFEQVFKTVHSLLASDRDSHARRIAMFDALDSLEGLRVGLSFEQMTRLGYAEATLGRLGSTMPPDVASVLLPKARSSVEGLADVQQGFFLRPRLTRRGFVRPDKSGREVEISLESASSEYLRMLRNSGHGFSRGGRATRTKDQALLVSHTGTLSDALFDLPYLYLLSVLANPSALRRFAPRVSDPPSGSRTDRVAE